MTVWTSVLWKINIHMAKNCQKRSYNSHLWVTFVSKQSLFLKTYRKWSAQKYIQKNSYNNFKKRFHFFLVFYLIMSFMKAPKNFGKISILKIWEVVGFLRRCQNSLRQNSPEIMHFQEWKKMFLTNFIL